MRAISIRLMLAHHTDDATTNMSPLWAVEDMVVSALGHIELEIDPPVDSIVGTRKCSCSLEVMVARLPPHS